MAAHEQINGYDVIFYILTQGHDSARDSSHGGAFAGDWQSRCPVPNPKIDKAISAL
jgi:hypothetical protein